MSNSLLILGSTGLVGGQVVKFAQTSKDFSKIFTVTRRKPEFANTASTTESPRIDTIVETDSSKWPQAISNLEPAPLAYISAFGTTRANAGSAEKFKEIDYGINYESAKAAKEAGAKVCVLVSSYGANAKSPFLYMKTKGELENAIIDLKFPYTIILQPGVLLGERNESKGFGNDWAVKFGKLCKGTWFAPLLQPIEASDLGRIAVEFAERGLKGEFRENVLKVSGSELTELVDDFKIV
ncbi:Protein fmp52, mitochondrial [Lodderomyces elongisporus]|uniref:Protein FMP52, mitochondrial n=1 Tax=Lodderomyces elongisporus (strain ATCC 11503 / CBS 2605 / JCM 1781 / NBRC 1676 / NRRL YB-4239) TaxID=379508 RepID=FMP52_LODEL|nr:Protein fmp52, mitochondrial [Lodderomyces elongisporus]A5DSN1.1 RecName: Full=Protein FMP52, mitochondrial; Flags: Precursor [Lodderomyces elongisporus NRRL YB-4239]EDK42189.1 conserved hypothetical protein [Lodderomyces elongisporus NRRL YB-4239]WLF76656.1 Protein fmp52, mitochondrial [Lodderomyces elongisporus]